VTAVAKSRGRLSNSAAAHLASAGCLSGANKADMFDFDALEGKQESPSKMAGKDEKGGKSDKEMTMTANGKQGATDGVEAEDDRTYHCAQCEEAAELGAIDDDDGQWYCKACWESLVEAAEEGAEAEAEAAEEGAEEAAEDASKEPAATPTKDTKAEAPAGSDTGNQKAAETDAKEPPAMTAQEPPAVKTDDAEVEEEERLYVCGECGESPELGAVDDTDGVWYCKTCWEDFANQRTPAATPMASSGRDSIDFGKDSPVAPLATPDVPALPAPLATPDVPASPAKLEEPDTKASDEKVTDKAADPVTAKEDAAEEGKGDDQPGDGEPEEELLYTCADCGEAAALGAIDDDDGQWYCKTCWERLLGEPEEAAQVA